MFAGSSLTDVMAAAERSFEAEHEDVDIRLNLAGSNALARQIDDGGEAEVFVPADRSALDDLTVPVGRVVELGVNELVMIVPAGSSIPSAAGGEPTPADVLRWADSFARCATGVPCGDAADRWITAERGLPSANRISIENNVRAVLSKVRTGEVQSGLVYRTDADAAAGDVDVIELGPNTPTVEIVAAAVDDGTDDPATAVFLDYLSSADVQNLFAEAGFGRP